MPKLIVMFPPRVGAKSHQLLQLQAEFPEVRAAFNILSEIMGLRLDTDSFAFQVCASDGYCGQLIEQAAAVGLYRALVARGVRPDFVAAHSLGVYSALAATGCLSLAQGFKLLRSHIACVLSRPGELTTIVNAPVEEVADFCSSIREIEVSAHNADKLCTVSGTPSGLAQIEVWAVQRHAKFRRLGGFGAWHYSGNLPLSQKLLDLAATHVMRDADVPIWFPLRSPRCVVHREDVIGAVVEQVMTSVLWHDFLRYILSEESAICIEVGPLLKLSKFLHPRDPKRAHMRAFHTKEALGRLVRALKEEEGDPNSDYPRPGLVPVSQALNYPRN